MILKEKNIASWKIIGKLNINIIEISQERT